MRKFAIFFVAAFAVALIITAAPVSAETLALTMNCNKAGDTWGTMCQNAEVNGGEGTEILYNYNVNGHLETSRRQATPHTQALNSGGTGDDLGQAQRTNGSCNTSWNSLWMGDSVDVAPGDQIVAIAAFTTDPTNIVGSAGAPWTTGAFAGNSSWNGHMAVFAGLIEGDGNTALNQNSGSTNPGVTDLMVGGYAAGASMMITQLNPNTGQGNWGHIEWSADPIPVYNTGGANNLGNSVVMGWNVWSSTIAAGTTTPSDFSAGNGVDFLNGAGTIRSDGTAVAAGVGNHSGLSGGGNFYYNDGFADGVTNPDTNYAVGPVFATAGTWAAGVNGFMEGSSWYPLSGPGASLGSMGTPSQVTSFSAELNPRGDKVTLNWKTGSEADLIGFNIVRKFRLNGRDRGQGVRVNKDMIPALGVDGSDYSFVDPLRLPAQLKRARAVSVVYELEIVAVDGTSSVGMTTSVDMAQTAQR